MSIFGTILSKLGFGDAKKNEAAPAPTAMREVDVVAVWGYGVCTRTGVYANKMCR